MQQVLVAVLVALAFLQQVHPRAGWSRGGRG